MVTNFKKIFKNKKKVMLVFLIVLIFAWLLNHFIFLKNIAGEDSTNNYALDENATEIVTEIEQNHIADTIDIPGYPNEINIHEGQTSTAIQLVNPEKNDVYFKFTISLGKFTNESFEENEILYESDLVKPGEVIKEQKLNRSLEKGTHEAAIEIETYSIESQQEMNGARTMTKLIVQ